MMIIVGGQYGGEGKGKVTSYLSLRDNPAIAARGGGPNSGHMCTIIIGNIV
ncbi:adenylosuccinate synthetase [Candidatus Bathyarchaeota archaeon]|nr:adenylosuccinate synthetase [Candidatus Bathyarchaeota archaeon]